MANPEHVEIVKKGAGAGAQWRKAKAEIRLDLSDADLRGAELTGADLRWADLSEANLGRASLKGANLGGADLSEANLRRANLSGADLRGANLRGTELSEADLSEAYLFQAKLSEAKLSEADLSKAYLSGAYLSEANLCKANLSEADLSEASLNKADLSGADLSEANLNKADLRGADLYRANLSGADLSEANLNKADLRWADLSEADLREADLREARFIFATLIQADLRGADLSFAIFDETSLSRCDISKARGLDSVEHHGPSPVDIHTIIASKGKIPEVFLRGCGVPEEWITHIPSILRSMRPIQFYSCFISYSHADKSFAQRLYEALQARGIRCWLDEHQLLPGDDPHEQIDRGIRLWDKVLLCASKDSLTSWWVDNEIATAFEKERQLMKDRGKKVLVLIPLDLDGYLFSKDCPNAKQTQLKTRIAAKFNGWDKDNALFEREFDRLINALKPNDAGREKPPPPKL